MPRAIFFPLALLTCFALASLSSAQAPTPAPMLAVPTLVPTVAASESGAPPSSALDELQATGVFRVGLLYNSPPFSELTAQGELRGFDVDLLRMIAELWGVELELSQVTRSNAFDKLAAGAVGALASVTPRYRELDALADFSGAYLYGAQAMMTRSDTPELGLNDLRGRDIGYVLGTRAETALRLWGEDLEAGESHQAYLTLDRALAALTRGEVDGVLAEEQDLLRVSRDFSSEMRLLDQPALREPHAIALRRGDEAMRLLLNRSLQYLAHEEALQKLHREYFPEATFPEDALAPWSNIGDAVQPAQFVGERAAAHDALSHVQRTRQLRVGGIRQAGAGADRLRDLNLALARELARRWGVEPRVVDSGTEDGLALLRAGEIDLLAGLRPDWNLAAQADFSAPYLLHGDRLMVPRASGIRGFNDLRGDWIAVLADDPPSRERAQAWADSINATVRFLRTPAAGATSALLEFNNADAVYADSLALIPHLEASPNALTLTERWYSRAYYAFALPANDREFRLLVDYTLQALVLDGTLERLSAALTLDDAPPDFDITPGVATIAGLSLSSH